ncbi:MAG: hypothetical protein AAFY67_22955 [Cyanobacteria bacterium J06642_9]
MLTVKQAHTALQMMRKYSKIQLEPNGYSLPMAWEEISHQYRERTIESAPSRIRMVLQRDEEHGTYIAISYTGDTAIREALGECVEYGDMWYKWSDSEYGFSLRGTEALLAVAAGLIEDGYDWYVDPDIEAAYYFWQEEQSRISIAPEFAPIYAQGDPENGIGGYDLKSPADRAFASDYDGSGELDHLALYRPETDTIKVINGYEVEQVDFGAGREKLGAYYQTGSNAWKETDKQGRTTFEFVETNRDQWSVYLEDPSRKVKIQVDLHTKKVRCIDPNTPIRDQYYDVLSSAAVNGWMLAEAMFGSLGGSGTQLGSYFQTGAKSWYERNAEGKKTFEFTETNRDDWSVYLLDSSRKVSIQIDNWTKKIFYSDPNTPRREQYNVLSVAPANGWIVREAVFGEGANTFGRFRQVDGTKNWQELDKNGKVVFNFVENNRDEWSVYLLDSSRKVSIHIDNWTKKIKIFYSDPNTPRREQYELLYAKCDRRSCRLGFAPY